MPLITDKFGRASIPSDVAIATTVSATRPAGTLVLAGVDLSKYATDTPVFVITYRKTTDPVTGVVSISQLRSWKALVNTGANTLTNLTIQPGYADDIGNAIGDFIECIPTSAWENSLIDGIRTSLNDDGTLKTTAVQSALGIVNNPAAGWNVLAQALTYLTNNGNGEYTGSFNGDMTSILSPGMKLLVPRSVAPPTQAMSFALASSQYASKAAAVTATGNTVTVEGYVYVNSYGSQQTLFATTDAGQTAGLKFGFTNNGQVFIQTLSSLPSNRFWTSLQVVPLKRWVFISVTVDTTAAAATAANFYINATLVSGVNTANTGTGLGSGSTVQIGRSAGGGEYFDGYVGEMRLWSGIRTAAQIQANMNIALTGGEANLLGVWQGNGNFNDKTAAANNLTAAGGATATTLMSTIGSAYANATEYLFVTKVNAFAAGVTPVTLYGGIDGHLPNATLGTIQYSNAKTPFGFPDDSRFLISAIDSTGLITAALALLVARYVTPMVMDNLLFLNTGGIAGYVTLNITGTRKTASITTPNVAVGANSNASWSVNFPAGFFTGTPVGTAVANNLSAITELYANLSGISNSGVSGFVSNRVGSAGSAGVGIIAVGT